MSVAPLATLTTHAGYAIRGSFDTMARASAESKRAATVALVALMCLGTASLCALPAAAQEEDECKCHAPTHPGATESYDGVLSHCAPCGAL